MAVIHYHGTRLSGDQLTTVRALKGKHAMISLADPGDIEIIAEVCQSFTFDNGAFTAWKQGKTYDIEEYARFVEKWFRHPAFDWYCIPDVIDGTEADNIAMRAKWRESCPKGAWRLGVPVWHMHESLEGLAYLCHAYDRVAIGSSGEYATVGNAAWWGRMGDAMRVACDTDGRPKAKLHGLRMLDPTVFSHLPLSSADSTNVARNIGIDSAWKGTYVPQSREVRAAIMMERVESHCSAKRWCGDSAGTQQNLELFG
jgi:hypothetical protein